MKKTKYLNDGDAWMIAEEIPNIDFQFSQIWLSSFVNDLEKTIGINYKKVISVYNNGYNLKFYYGDKDSEAVSSVILQKIVDVNFGSTINKNIRRVADELFEISKKITPEFLKALSNKKLSDFYKKLDDIHTEFYSWCWLPNAVDMFHAHFTNYLKSILEKHSKSEGEVNAALVALSFSEEKSFIQDELESLLKLAVFKKEHTDDKATFEKMLADHHSRYFYLKHLWIGKDGVSTIKECRREIDKMITEHNPKEVLESEYKKRAGDKKLRDNYEKKLNLSEKEKELFKTYAEFAFTKTYRRRIQLYWAYKMDFIFKELSKRFGINFIESRFLMPKEVAEGLKNGLSDEMKKVVAERIKHCVYYAEKDLDIVVIGDDCKKFESTIIEETNHEIEEFKGQVACIGKVQGLVKIVNSTSDMNKVNDGDILVSIATNPDILPAMKKAIAFVTEQGGITSHAAIISRELKKPCIIGTKIATKVLKDGDLVEVDADRGIVKILKKNDEEGNKEEKLELYKQNAKIGFFQVFLPFITMTRRMQRYFKNSYGTIWLHSYKGHFTSLLQKKYMSKISEEVFEMEKDGSFYELWSKWPKIEQELFQQAKHIRDLNVASLSNEDLWSEYQKIYEEDLNMWDISIFIDALDVGLDQEEIDKIIKACGFSTDEAYILLTPTKQSYVTIIENNLYRVQQGKMSPEDFIGQYFWYGTDYSKYEELNSRSVKKLAVKAEYTKFEKVDKKQEAVLKKYNLESNPLKLFQILAQWRDERKRSNYIGLYGVCKLVAEGLKRQRVDPRLMNDLLNTEIKNVFLGAFNAETLINRIKTHVVSKINKDGSWSIVGGDEAEAEFQRLQKFLPNTEVVEIIGTIASPGIVQGKVRVVSHLSSESGRLFKDGDILVTSMTRPEFVPLMRKCGAIVTNEGGISCHAAIIARELKKPCIIGTKIATQVLKDSDLVEVDADRGIVKIIKKQHSNILSQ